MTISPPVNTSLRTRQDHPPVKISTRATRHVQPLLSITERSLTLVLSQKIRNQHHRIFMIVFQDPILPVGLTTEPILQVGLMKDQILPAGSMTENQEVLLT